MSFNPAQFVCVADVEGEAVVRLPRAVRDYFVSGADDEQTLARNRRAFRRLLIRPLSLRDVSRLDASVRIRLRNGAGVVCFDHRFPSPIGSFSWGWQLDVLVQQNVHWPTIAPTACQKLCHERGEEATAEAAAATGTLMINSTISTTPLEVVAERTAGGVVFFQLYVYKDRPLTERLVRRAEAAGFSALVLTVDAPLFGRRRADERNGFELPPHLELANFPKMRHSEVTSSGAGQSGMAAYTRSLFDQTLNWRDLKWLVIVKGIMRADDALQAVEHGAAGVVVSNHGGRQLDAAPATVEALPEVVRAVGGRVPVFVDGGIRSGTDVFKAVALGAHAVLIGRPVVFGLTVGGAAGVKHVIGLLRDEFNHALQLSGCPSIEDVRKNNQMIVHESFYSHL
ncbi:Peroxisomal (S)-2-hydroxy-acid oxidase GLO3 [Aphelenchoides fujianensis]|nr:Peroxisomal (S)-2-hydroxy-acid oxidase GLO3 [Aphelenchoides fujianensis]